MTIKTISIGLIIAGFTLLFSGCAKPPDFPTIPEIAFVEFNQNTIVQAGPTTNRDTLEVTFSFTDGDGDIGSEDDLNIFLTDSRDGSLITFKVNPLPEQGIGNGISGAITLKIPNDQICCILPDGRTCVADPEFPIDRMRYSIQMTDRFGNESNVVETSELTILCE